jgi:hypothetical protein
MVNLDFLFSGSMLLGPITAHHEACAISLGRNEDRSWRAADQDGPGMAVYLSRSLPDYGWIGLSFGGCSSRPPGSSKGHWSWRLVDFATGGSLGDNWIRSQRSLHLWRRSGARWNCKNLLGRRRHRHVRGRSAGLRTGFTVPQSWQTGKMSKASRPWTKMERYKQLASP